MSGYEHGTQRVPPAAFGAPIIQAGFLFNPVEAIEFLNLYEDHRHKDEAYKHFLSNADADVDQEDLYCEKALLDEAYEKLNKPIIRLRQNVNRAVELGYLIPSGIGEDHLRRDIDAGLWKQQNDVPKKDWLRGNLLFQGLRFFDVRVRPTGEADYNRACLATASFNNLISAFVRQTTRKNIETLLYWQLVDAIKSGHVTVVPAIAREQAERLAARRSIFVDEADPEALTVRFRDQITTSPFPVHVTNWADAAPVAATLERASSISARAEMLGAFQVMYASLKPNDKLALRLALQLKRQPSHDSANKLAGKHAEEWAGAATIDSKISQLGKAIRHWSENPLLENWKAIDPSDFQKNPKNSKDDDV